MPTDMESLLEMYCREKGWVRAEPLPLDPVVSMRHVVNEEDYFGLPGSDDQHSHHEMQGVLLDWLVKEKGFIAINYDLILMEH